MKNDFQIPHECLKLDSNLQMTEVHYEDKIQELNEENQFLSEELEKIYSKISIYVRTLRTLLFIF